MDSKRTAVYRTVISILLSALLLGALGGATGTYPGHHDPTESRSHHTYTEQRVTTDGDDTTVKRYVHGDAGTVSQHVQSGDSVHARQHVTHSSRSVHGEKFYDKKRYKKDDRDGREPEDPGDDEPDDTPEPPQNGPDDDDDTSPDDPDDDDDTSQEPDEPDEPSEPDDDDAENSTGEGEGTGDADDNGAQNDTDTQEPGDGTDTTPDDEDNGSVIGNGTVDDEVTEGVTYLTPQGGSRLIGSVSRTQPAPGDGVTEEPRRGFWTWLQGLFAWFVAVIQELVSDLGRIGTL